MGIMAGAKRHKREREPQQRMKMLHREDEPRELEVEAREHLTEIHQEKIGSVSSPCFLCAPFPCTCFYGVE